MLAWGFTGGKNEIGCGDGGRVTAGRCTREERAAEEDEDDIVERVRWRSCNGLSFKLECIGSVATDRVEEIEVRRCDGNGTSGEDGEVNAVR